MIKKSKYVWWIGIAILLILIGGTYRYTSRYRIQLIKVCQGSNCFDLETAKTPQQREKWLMYREAWKKTQWMIFFFSQEDYHDFWMKNTHLPLDILRLDTEKYIVDIQEASPCLQGQCPVYHPSHPAQYVIEFPQGTTKNNHWKEWMQFSF